MVPLEPGTRRRRHSAPGQCRCRAGGWAARCRCKRHSSLWRRAPTRLRTPAGASVTVPATMDTGRISYSTAHFAERAIQRGPSIGGALCVQACPTCASPPPTVNLSAAVWRVKRRHCWLFPGCRGPNGTAVYHVHQCGAAARPPPARHGDWPTAAAAGVYRPVQLLPGGQSGTILCAALLSCASAGAGGLRGAAGWVASHIKVKAHARLHLPP